MITIETENSFYELDITLMKYCRWPKGERLQSAMSHRLTYEEWHPMKHFRLNCRCELAHWPHLHLWREDSINGIFTTKIMTLIVDDEVAI